MTKHPLKVSDYRKARRTIARLEWGMIALLVTIFLVTAQLVHDKRIMQEKLDQYAAESATRQASIYK